MTLPIPPGGPRRIRIVAVCSNCSKPWEDCLGSCYNPSAFSDNPVLQEISKWAEEYVSKLEVELTEESCLCEWIYRDGKPKQLEVTTQQELSEGTRSYLPGATPRLRVRSTEHPECPVHTRRGLLVGFYQWATTEKDFIALWSVASALDVCADEERIEAEAEEAYQEGLTGEADAFSDESDSLESLSDDEIERL